jgi:hypothetical protein
MFVFIPFPATQPVCNADFIFKPLEVQGVIYVGWFLWQN